MLRDDEVLISYNVKSLFTSLPVEESIQVCEKRLIVDKMLSERTQLDVPTIIQLLLSGINGIPIQRSALQTARWCCDGLTCLPDHR